MMSFGEKLKSLRKSKYYSMDKLAEIYNDRFGGRLNKSTISRYENGLQEPMLTVVKNFADIFGVSADFLIDNSANPYDKEPPQIASTINLFDSILPSKNFRSDDRSMLLDSSFAALVAERLAQELNNSNKTEFPADYKIAAVADTEERKLLSKYRMLDASDKLKLRKYLSDLFNQSKYI